jgi:hypothetical protein
MVHVLLLVIESNKIDYDHEQEREHEWQSSFSPLRMLRLGA